MDEDALVLLIRSEARLTRDRVLEAAGLALMVIGGALAVGFGLIMDGGMAGWTIPLFWTSLLGIGPAGTAMLLWGYLDGRDARKGVSGAVEALWRGRQ